MPMGVIAAYRSLNAEQKQIIKERIVNVNRPVDELLALLRPLAACDKLVGKSGKFGCYGGLAIPLVILTAILTSNGVLPGAVGGLLVVALIVAMIASFVLWGWAKSIDLHDGLNSFTLPMLSVFRDDFDREKPLHLQLDLRAPDHKEKLVSKGDPYKKGAYHKIIDSIYKDEWCSGEGVLTDGSKLRWSVRDAIRKRDKTKKTASGKYKSKTKYKKITTLDVSLTLKKKRYAVAGAEGQTIEEGENAHTVQLRRRVRSESLVPIALDPFVDAVTGIYSNAKPLKEK
jgi:hypothetical protein